ncbi:hypothetical protein [Devosia sp. RR2S18]|uniref:hypothetical protein n=1 Tax=Devosia rhizosphaerae TaxID=3049774 RepID=UPI0025417B3F|nr:hypothetical protein [Devosia sp. RR2S18]WIJ26898.1 hypothetical protein QOV41_09175 [Devosia sp. RR2S18]
MSLVVEKGGEPATDLEPYLGVAAHAVLVRAEDLTYVHAHAMAEGDHSHEDHGSMEQQGHMGGHDHEPAAYDERGAGSREEHGHGHMADMSHSSSAGHVGHAGHGTGESDAAAVAAEMSIHLTPHAPGTYALWVEFIGGGEVVTVPFALQIPQEIDLLQ